MGRLIIDGNMIYEIDEECLKMRNTPEECGVKKALEKQKESARTDNKEHSVRFAR